MGIKEVYISVGYQKEKLISIINPIYNNDDFKINFVEVDCSTKPGSSLFKVIKLINSTDKTHKILITLADTIAFYDINQLTSAESSILVSNHIDIKEYWATVKTDEFCNIKKIYEKNSSVKTDKALAGVYYFNDSKIFNDFEKTDCEISELFEHLFNKNINIKAVQTEKWFDTGHLSKYYKSKKELLSARYFNSFQYDDILGILRKESTNIKKLRNEILWYENIPKELKALSPKILDYSLDNNVFIEMEYYGYPSLAELWIYGNLSLDIWKSILDRLFQVVEIFKKYKGEVSLKSYKEMYLDKTLERIEEIKNQDSDLTRLFNLDSVIINEKKLKGWIFFENKLENLTKKLFNIEDNTVIHGDYCFSNILFDINNGIIRLIDPRGTWGDNLIYGDIKYDIAKLRHSISGKYDFIVNNLFNIRSSQENLEVNYFYDEKLYLGITDHFDFLVSKYFDLEQIKFIEGLLFFSMLPIHKDHPARQLAMFTQGLEIFNSLEIFNFQTTDEFVKTN
jgi:dTDP-glucose pyrophosphorylase